MAQVMGLDQDTAIRLLLSNRVALLGWLRAMVHDAHLAEDLFQEVSLVVLNKCGEIHDPLCFPKWVRKVARHKVLHARRDRRNKPLIFSEELMELFEPHWAAWDETASGDQLCALQKCLENLSPYARQLVRLRHEEGKSGAALAAALDRPINTVYVALSRTYHRLADCIRGRLTWKESADG